MKARKTNTLFWQKPNVAGTIHSPSSLKRALRLPPGAVDAFELRVDSFASSPEVLVRGAVQLTSPLIVTVRSGAEGGAAPLPTARRRELFAHFLPLASLVDIELKSCRGLESIIASAKERGVAVILSSHEFTKVPCAQEIADRIRRAKEAGADLFKLAAFVASSSDLGKLLDLFSTPAPIPLSVMGMGPYGKISRLVLARAGSILNYGYLDEPQVAGQWKATLLKKRIAELWAES